MKYTRTILLLLTTVLILGCGIENKMPDENETKKIEVIEKKESVNTNEEENVINKSKCIVGEILSIEEEYIYMKGAEDLNYRVYTKQMGNFTVGNYLYVFYSDKEQIDESEYKLIAEKVEEEDPKKQRRK